MKYEMTFKKLGKKQLKNSQKIAFFTKFYQNDDAIVPHVQLAYTQFNGCCSVAYRPVTMPEKYDLEWW